MKADHRFNENNTMSYRYQIRFNNTIDSVRRAARWATFGNKVNDDRSLMGIDFTHLFTPTFLVEFAQRIQPQHERPERRLGRHRRRRAVRPARFHARIRICRLPAVQCHRLCLARRRRQRAGAVRVTDIQYAAKFTWVKARHVMKWGFEYDRTRFNQPFFNNNRGTFNFTGSWITALRWPIFCWAS